VSSGGTGLGRFVASEVVSEWLPRFARADRVVVLSGAGVSQESGLGTFRGAGGVWQRFRAEDLATAEAFARAPALVWGWYAERFAAMCRAEPNPAHRTIASWDDRFPSLTVVTQNVDGLHQRAGSRDVVELHGTLGRSHCADCGRSRPTAELIDPETGSDPAVAQREPPGCSCGGLFRPSVVWFGEALPAAAFERAHRLARESEIFLVVGTSAEVWPAAGLIEVAAGAGALVVEVNVEPSALAHRVAVELTGAAGAVLPALEAELGRWRSRS
jgi:NAD-dependent deacetylase